MFSMGDPGLGCCRPSLSFAWRAATLASDSAVALPMVSGSVRGRATRFTAV